MLDVAFDGRVLDEAGDPLDGAYLQPFFDRVLSGSSADTWGPVQQVGADGYFSFNLGDGDFLTQDGAAGDGDKVLLAVWVGEAPRLGTGKTAFSFRVVTLAGATYTRDVRALSDRVPTSSFSVPASVARLASMPLTNQSTDDSADGNETQAWQYQGTTVFDAAGVDHVDVDWGDGQSGTLTGTANGSHAYSLDGGTTVTVSATATDERGNVGTPAAHDVGIRWRAPVGGFSWLPSSPETADSVTFSPSIADADSRGTSVDYSVNGVTVQSGLAVGATWAQVFAGAGTYAVRQTVHWHDGFATQATVHDASVTVSNRLPTAEFSSTGNDVSARRIVWDGSASSDPEGPISSYAWELERSDGVGGWLPEASSSGAGADQFSYAFSASGSYRITLTVTDADGGQDSKISTFSVLVQPGTGGAYLITQVRVLRVNVKTRVLKVREVA
jgi:hypothetical protein